MAQELLRSFRSKINDKELILHIFRNRFGRNKWSIICSAMDWIEVSNDGIDVSNLSRKNEIMFEDYTESPSCIELEEGCSISTEVVSETDLFYEESGGEQNYVTDICPDCGTPIGIENDGGKRVQIVL